MENDSPGSTRRMKRCLFGKPDRNEVEKWLSDTKQKQMKSKTAKWSYDFELDRPVSGDVEYEILSADKVPSVYKSCTLRTKKARKASEFDPNIPSVSTDSKSDYSSNHRPHTRSFVKQQGDDNSRNLRSLKQAKLTNYLKVRKRRSLESQSPKRVTLSLKSMKSVAPSSPFRFVDDVQGDGVIPDSSSPRSSSSSPSKSPRKRPAQKIVQEVPPRIPKLRSHTVVNQ